MATPPSRSKELLLAAYERNLADRDALATVFAHATKRDDGWATVLAYLESLADDDRAVMICREDGETILVVLDICGDHKTEFRGNSLAACLVQPTTRKL